MVSILFQILFFTSPLLVSPINSELFELPKMYFVYLLTILILFFHLYNFFKSKIPLFKTHFLNLPLLIFLSSQFISSLTSIDPHSSLFGYYSRLNGGLLSLISFTLLFFILNVYIDKKLINKIINTSLLSGALVSLYAIAQHFGIDDSYWIQDVRSRVFSTFGQPNWLASYLTILLSFSIYKFIKTKKTYFLILTASFYLSLIYSGSRSGLVAVIISLGLFFFLYLIKFKKILFIPILIFIALTFLTDNPIKSKIFKNNSSSSATTTNTNNTINVTDSTDIRKLVWQGAIKLGLQYPLFGTGPETFAYSYYWVRPAAHNLTSEWDFLYNKAHNEYLNYLATTGFIGLITYLVLIFITLINLVKTARKSPLLQVEDPRQGRGMPKGQGGLLSLTLLSAYLSILITNFAGFSVVVTSLYFFLIPVFIPQKSNQFLKLKSSIPKKYFLLIAVSCLYLIQFPIKYFMADIFYAQSKKYETIPAQKFLDSALNLWPNQPVYLSASALNLAKIYTKNQDPHQLSLCLSQVEKATRISPSNINVLKLRAQTLYYLATIDSTYFQKSIDTLTVIEKLAPTDAKTFYTTAKFYLSADQVELAQQQLQKAVQLKPNYDHAWFYLGVIQFEQENFDAAKISFQKVLEINPNNTDVQDYLDKI